MLRLMNILAVLALLGSAVYAYSIKYATLYQAERMATLKHELTKETDALAMMKAEWAHIAAPVRIEALADQYLGGQVMELSQIATPSSLPEKGAAVDSLGATLNELGLGDGKPDPALAARLAATPDGPAAKAPDAAKASTAKPAAAKTLTAAKPLTASKPQALIGKPLTAPKAAERAAGANPAATKPAAAKPVATKPAAAKPAVVDPQPTATIRTGR